MEDATKLLARVNKVEKQVAKVIAAEKPEEKSVPALLKLVDTIGEEFTEIMNNAKTFLGDAPKEKRVRQRPAAAQNPAN